MTPKPLPVDIDKLVHLYLAGQSCQDLAHVFGVSDATLRRRLKAAGVDIRQGPSYRGPDALETKVKRARTREEETLHAGPTEATVAALLDALGVGYRQQTAIGHYNVDFTLTELPVAVEVVTGSGNAHIRANRRERVEYLRNSGWHVVDLIANLGSIKAPPNLAGAEQLVALVQSFGPNPPARGQHRVIRADGQPYTPRSRQLD